MTTLAPYTDRARAHADRVLEAAQAVLADPNNMTARTAFLRRCFNIDWLAAAIVTLAKPEAEQPEPETREMFS